MESASRPPSPTATQITSHNNTSSISFLRHSSQNFSAQNLKPVEKWVSLTGQRVEQRADQSGRVPGPPRMLLSVLPLLVFFVDQAASLPPLLLLPAPRQVVPWLSPAPHCPAGGGVFPHGTDCHQYIDCSPSGQVSPFCHKQTNAISVQLLNVSRCPPGTLFDPLTSACSDQAECVSLEGRSVATVR